jgi:hypothetical protein
MVADIKKQRKKPLPVVRRYEIGGVTYVVTATESEGAFERAETKIRRMMRNDVLRMARKED